jgi:hydroxymethylglutaryl-CoA reductase
LSLISGSSVWTDQDDAPLESRIAEISAGLIVQGELSYRRHLRRLEEEAERKRVEAERRRQERLRKANADRITALVESGRLLAEAENMRGLIARVASAVAAGQLDLTVEQLAEWRRWADEEADKLDPVLSGQVRKHLLPPRIE